MKLVWTRSTWFGDNDDIITWAFGHRAGHFALSFFDETIYYHSTIGGVQVNEAQEFYKHRIKVYEIDVNLSSEEEVELFQAMVSMYAGLEYDYKFFWWLAWVGFKRKIFGIKPPLFIKHQNPAAIICQEVLNLLPDDIRPHIDFKRSVMPETMYLMVRESLEGSVYEL